MGVEVIGGGAPGAAGTGVEASELAGTELVAAPPGDAEVLDTSAAPAAGRRARSRSRSWLHPKIWLPPLILFGLLVLAWQLYGRTGDNRLRLPPASDVLSKIGDDPNLFWQALLVTLQEAVVGAAIGMGAAFVLATLMRQFMVINRAVLPLAIVISVTPLLAIAPALTIAFGFGFTPKYILVALIVFFPFLINTLAGLASADQQALDVFATLHASWWEVYWRLRLPSSLPYLFAGARICVPLSVIAAVVAEFTSASTTHYGLGSLITTAANLSDLTTLYACVVCLAALGIALTILVVLLQSWVLRWNQPSTR
jgi:NitT/TauT family transport system permease protein